MDYKQIGVFLIFTLLLFGCVTQNDNSDQNSASLFKEPINCDDNLDCLINSVILGNFAKATVQSSILVFDKQYVNKDYLEIKKEDNKFLLYRESLNLENESLNLSGTCLFSTDELLFFLKNWNEQSFNTDYYDEHECKGSLYVIGVKE